MHSWASSTFFLVAACPISPSFFWVWLPYITASIIMQLLATMVPSLERLSKEEGEQGRQKFNMITRWLTVPLAAAQSFSMLTLLRSQNILGDVQPFTACSRHYYRNGRHHLSYVAGRAYYREGIGKRRFNDYLCRYCIEPSDRFFASPFYLGSGPILYLCSILLGGGSHDCGRHPGE